MDFILPAVILAIPLIVMPGLLFHYDSVPKIALLALAMALVLARPRVLIDRLSRLWQTQLGKWLCILAMAQIAWTAVATATSTRVLFSIFGSGWRRFGLITVIAVVVFAVATAAQLLVSPDVTKSIFRAMSIAAIVTSIYTIAQYFGIDPFQNGAGYRAQDGDFTIVRPPGTLGHADYLGWWLAIALFCAWGLYRVAGGAWRMVALAATILAAIATVLSGTRSAIAAAIVATAFLLITGRARLSRRHYAAIGGIAVLSVVFYLSPAGTMLQARVKWSSDEAPGGARPLLWRDTLKMIAAKPLMGFGPETFAAEFPRFQSEELSRLVPDFYHESPHNVALDAVTSEGIPGLLIAACWWALGVRAIVRSRDKNGPVDAALAAAFVASFVAALFNSMTIGPAVATMAVIAALVARQAAGDPPAVVKTTRARALTLAAVSAPVAGVLAGFAALLLFSDYKLERFRRVAGDQKSPRAAVVAYQDLRESILKGAGDDLYCSRRLAASCTAGATPVERLECSQFATQAAMRATLTSDNPPNAWYNLAMFAAAHNDARGAEEALRKSIELAPNWFRPHLALANYLKVKGRGDEAEVQLRRAGYLSAQKAGAQ